MVLTFHKFHGAGNDFIIIDDREGVFGNQVIDLQKFIEFLCSRHFGIGADGLMLLQNSEVADFSMVYFNSDGFEGSLCGNGGRCIVAFAQTLGIVNTQTRFLAADGIHQAQINRYGNGTWDISLEMNDVNSVQLAKEGYLVNTGSPHLVIFSDKISEMNVFSEGRAIRYSAAFAKEGINVNFAEVLDSETILIRTYERGVENETLACGTGATAVALAAHASGFSNPTNQFVLQAQGGQLRVNFQPSENGNYTNIWLSGPAKKVFEGKIDF